MSNEPSPEQEQSSAPPEEAEAPQQELNCKVFIGNIGSSMKESDIRDAFSKYGEILDLNIAKHKSGRSRGCAFVKFATHEQAEDAIQNLNETMVADRKIRVMFSDSKSKQDKRKAPSHERRDYSSDDESPVRRRRRDSIDERIDALEDMIRDVRHMIRDRERDRRSRRRSYNSDDSS